MIGGQCADIEAENVTSEKITEERLLYIHSHKTSALIEDALMVGAILAGASEMDLAKIERCGYNIGLAFQIQDDILDVTSTTEQLGKPVGSDEKNGKTTYVSIHGLEKAKQDAKALSDEAVELVKGLGEGNDFLQELIIYLVDRTK